MEGSQALHPSIHFVALVVMVKHVVLVGQESHRGAWENAGN